MSRARLAKKMIAELLASPAWRERADEIIAMGLAGVNALFSFLPKDALTKHSAALCMGRAVAALAQGEPEAARNIVRRLMWHMNEDSGNIGWGIPEAFGEILAASEVLAEQYGNILISYIMRLPGADNYCDNALLRRSCYWAVGRLAEARPGLAHKARPWLARGLEDEDVVCRGMAAWALARLKPDIMLMPALRRLAEAGHPEPCVLFDGENVFERSVNALAREAFEKIQDSSL
ncbi:MAG: HEAT repeat domain-containing protein [Desulfovibrio sp.]|jgi:hypothetical protein|nr:HEAT repeat domain-containing protein [Desulfovibrio sp.]